MKKVLTLLAVLMMVSSIYAQNVGVVAYYNAPTAAEDSVLSGLTSLRGANYIDDLLGDGNSAIAVTNYNYGTVQVFANTGTDNQIELKWISPTDISAGGSTPRYVAFGDLDNDGLNEVIVQLAGIGVAIFEWDGVAGSYNFGTQPSQIVNFEALASASNSGHAEYFEITDVDGDSENELVIALNSSPNENDRYYIISAVGNWITNQPGFSGFTLEGEFVRTNMADYAVDGGSPYAMISADLNGNGKKEILLHNWNLKNVVPITVPSANTYNLPNTTNGNLQLGEGIDDVALFSGVAADLDNDGREEIYLPTYPGQDGEGGYPHIGWLHIIHYGDGEATNEITAENATVIDMSEITTLDQFGIGYGDLDGNGKPNVYVGGGNGVNINTAEFQGGDITDPANWTVANLFEREEGTYRRIVYKDSVGVLDTAYTYSSEFVSKLYAKNTDFDKDGKQDIIMPYQGTVDSIDVLNLTWNGTKYDTVTSKIQAEKRWGLKILEADGATSVELKEMDIVLPSDYVLEQNFPNPFNPTTNIRFSLPVNNNITLTVYDALGREVKTLLSGEELQKGSYEVTWDGTNNFGSKVSTGMYIYTLKYGNFSKSMKMMLVK
ncbi:MAG: hypothetical protein CMF23_14405 [Ignavibacteriae bacterium]|nr:hypothetical protein [Ignavibacteriota bacterium]